MRMVKNILGIIPARGGSKGVPRKNVRFLNGKPLIFYTISEALKSRFLNKVVVSTDSAVIGRLAKRYGAKVIERSRELAGDDIPTSYVVLDALSKLEKENYEPDIIVLLQPTSPFRKAHHIDEAIRLFLTRRCDFVVSVCETKKPPYWCFTIEKDHLKPVLEHYYPEKRRQDLPKTYLLNGAIFIYTPDKLKDGLNYYNSITLPYLMRLEESVDIDDKLDFIFAEALVRSSKDERS